MANLTTMTLRLLAEIVEKHLKDRVISKTFHSDVTHVVSISWMRIISYSSNFSRLFYISIPVSILSTRRSCSYELHWAAHRYNGLNTDSKPAHVHSTKLHPTSTKMLVFISANSHVRYFVFWNVRKAPRISQNQRCWKLDKSHQERDASQFLEDFYLNSPNEAGFQLNGRSVAGVNVTPLHEWANSSCSFSTPVHSFYYLS